MSLTVAARRAFDFKVEDYSFASQMAGFCESFQSDTFHVGGYDWAVRFSPDLGVSLKLVILSKPKAVERVGVKFAFTLVDKSGKASAAVLQKKCSMFFFKGQEEGFDYFMSKKDLGKYIHRDCFVVRCTVSVLRQPKRY
ncbi:hypothetical protein QYE76_035851 [Lolium multiflorum]|uniref:MATH domain-containing protein n=1 Tax=Lolium multiflorum TaxID=4521 RepID=A0AAD8R3U2_LOLMU|nr:hypothetical protein QYE76_035851 [Lolium multiflorum]